MEIILMIVLGIIGVFVNFIVYINFIDFKKDINKDFLDSKETIKNEILKELAVNKIKKEEYNDSLSFISSLKNEILKDFAENKINIELKIIYFHSLLVYLESQLLMPEENKNRIVVFLVYFKYITHELIDFYNLVSKDFKIEINDEQKTRLNKEIEFFNNVTISLFNLVEENIIIFLEKKYHDEILYKNQLETLIINMIHIKIIKNIVKIEDCDKILSMLYNIKYNCLILKK